MQKHEKASFMRAILPLPFSFMQSILLCMILMSVLVIYHRGFGKILMVLLSAVSGNIRVMEESFQPIHAQAIDLLFAVFYQSNLKIFYGKRYFYQKA